MRLFLSSLSSSSPTESVFPIADDGYLYILSFGQSNMLGVNPKDKTEPLAGNFTDPTNVWIPDGFGGWQLARYFYEPFTTDGNNISITFCRDLADKYDLKIRLIFNAIGGNPLSSWLEDGQGKVILNQIYNAFVYYGTNDVRPAPLLLMHHGESGNGVGGETYEETWIRVRDGFIAEGWLYADCDFICGEVAAGKFSSSYLYDIATLSDGYKVASSGGLQQAELTHFMGIAYQLMGERFMARYEQILGLEVSPIDDTIPTTPVVTLDTTRTTDYDISWTASTPKDGLTIVGYIVQGMNGWITVKEVGNVLSATVDFTTETIPSVDWTGPSEIVNVLALDSQGNYSDTNNNNSIVAEPL